MSTIKATHISHPSASSPNFTLAADGSVSGGAGLGGLVHLHTESFSAVSSVSIDDVFSANYESYRFQLVITAASTTGNTFMRLRTSGSDNSSTQYGYGLAYKGFSTAAFGNLGGSSQTAWLIGYASTGVQGISHGDITSPFATSISHIRGFGGNPNNDFSVFGGNMTVTTSYDGLTVYPASGNITGTLRIYGYANQQ